MITGAGSGIGKATALLLARQGAEVVVLDVNEAAAQSTVNEIRQHTEKGFAVACDVTSEESVTEAFAKIEQVDVLVNSAGISHIGNIETTSTTDFERLYTVNVKGVFLCMKAAVQLMKAQGAGVIINLASVANHVGLNDRFAYSMTKGAVHAMTLSVAKDFIHHGIRCNSISPARVHTPFVDGFLQKNYPGREEEMFQKLSKTQPIGRMAKPEEIANLILYLCSDEASFLTGTDYPIDGGFINLNN